MKKINILLVIISISFLSSCAEKKEAISSTDTPIQVKISDVNLSGTSGFISASGKTEALNSANVSTRMMGYITKLNVKVGQKVNMGQSLLNINNSDLLAKKAQAEASVEQATHANTNAKKDYDRYVTLFNQQSVSQKELDDMLLKFEMAKASKEGALQMRNEVLAQFNYSDVTAPFTGIVTNTFVKEGDLATPGMPLVSIEGESAMQIISMVSESDIPFIKNNMAVNILVKSLNKELNGKVTELSPSSKNTGGQYLVKISFDKMDANVLSGMFVNIKFPVAKNQQDKQSSDVILVHQDALVMHGQLTGIYTIGHNNVAILRWLRIGEKIGDQVEVLSGLSSDEKYVLSADGKLFNGVKVSF